MLVDDLQAYFDKVVSLGGTLALPPMDIEVNGQKFSIACFIDPEGYSLGL